MANVRGTSSKPGSEKIEPSAGWSDDSNSQHLLVDLPGLKTEQVQIQVLSTGYLKVSGERVTYQNKTVSFDQTYKIPAAENADMSKITAKFDGEILYVTIPKKPKEEEQKKRDEEQKEEATPSLEKKKDDVVNGLEEKNNATQQQKHEDEVVPKNKEENTQKKLEKDEVKDSEAKTQQKPKDDEVKNKEGDEKSSKKEEKKLKGNEIKRFSEEDVKKWDDDGDFLSNTVKILSQNRGILLTAVVAFSLGLLLSRRFQAGR
ncbi:hypothetical protein FEM48_Zijuj05G0153400 [Ziziphus jujuba var. spinosa]|uniref:SHSP domain-containing protein n=1 Tax=Ziziphus jujuba var. spinosa TaxID=714518 RepID=A0A978VFK6_ZIZJJ|nr:hypothetical protein FEM48_Zijuj05G0153400 [Ziziphus jujuba var. spinosa]